MRRVSTKVLRIISCAADSLKEGENPVILFHLFRVYGLDKVETVRVSPLLTRHAPSRVRTQARRITLRPCSLSESKETEYYSPIGGMATYARVMCFKCLHTCVGRAPVVVMVVVEVVVMVVVVVVVVLVPPPLPQLLRLLLYCYYYYLVGTERCASHAGLVHVFLCQPLTVRCATVKGVGSGACACVCCGKLGWLACGSVRVKLVGICVKLHAD